jgi:hypothetical protein
MTFFPLAFTATASRCSLDLPQGAQAHAQRYRERTEHQRVLAAPDDHRERARTG